MVPEQLNRQFQDKRPTIGVLAGWQFYRTATNLSYLAPMFKGMSRAAQDVGCHLLLGCGIGPSASPVDPLRPAWPVLIPEVDFVPIGTWNTDGLIIANPLPFQALSDYAQQISAQGHPVLFVGAGEAGPTIVADNQGGILEAMSHLVTHGHTQIAFIAGTPEDMQGDSGERLRAYQSALDFHHLDPNPDLVVYGRHIYFGGYTAMQELLNHRVAFTAVLASNDESALGAMQALKESGRRVPDDVAVIGFDNRLEGAANIPGLSSVHVPLFNVGYHSLVTMAGHILEGKGLPPLVKVETRLVARDSCGCRFKGAAAQMADEPGDPSQLAWSLSERILNQAHSLTDEQCQAYCLQLADAFCNAVLHGERSKFKESLSQILQHTMRVEDDANIWQEAISILRRQTWDAKFEPALREILDEARMMISNSMQSQHQQYVLAERRVSSSLSLLTARLLTALDESQIYSILSRHLPDMDIRIAFLVLFEPEGDDPVAWSVVQDVLHVEKPLRRFPSKQFNPQSLFGTDQPASLTLVPLVDQSGQLGFMIFGAEHFDLYGPIAQQLGGALNTAHLYRQATEGRRLAEEANRMKSRFLSTISHELRTPINLILGLGGMVLRADAEGETSFSGETRRDIERIQTYSQHLAGLIGDVIDLATSDAGQLRLNNEYVNLSQTLRIVAESGSQMAADKNLMWFANLPETTSYVWGDQTRLRQVALNLINNAIKFTARGSVSLTLEERADSITVSVRDTGLGIPPDEQQAIFDEFRQSERSVAKGYGGLGVGLAICKKLIELHGGTISVYSTGEEGSGSVFSFTLPAVSRPLIDPMNSYAAGTEPNALIVTSDPGAMQKISGQLVSRGFKVKTAPLQKGFDWRVLLADFLPEILFLDLGADPASGWEMLKEFKSNQSMVGIPVAFFSSSQPEGSLLELDYLTKPIELPVLTKVLDQHALMSDTGRDARTILVVDDEPDTLEMHSRIIKSHSLSSRVLKAHNGKEAMHLMHREVVDLVLLDLQMPDMDGFEVLETMRGMESLRKIPVIVVTGKVITEAEMSRLTQGVTVVLGKGLFTIDETIAHISAALEHKRRLGIEAQRLVRSAMAFLHENFSNPISRQDIAQHVGISEDHLTFCFRQELGTTPIEYLHRYRINQSKQLLREGHKTITEIALSVGFSDSGYFSRIFRRETGMSPESFRRS